LFGWLRALLAIKRKRPCCRSEINKSKHAQAAKAGVSEELREGFESHQEDLARFDDLRPLPIF
jgi:hypothetical protein